MVRRIDRTGEINYNNFGNKMEIIRYSNCHDIDVYFEKYDCIITNRTYRSFLRGEIRCPYDLTLYNKGYLGIGEYSTSKHKHIHNEWRHMIERCYDEKFHIKKPTYANCEVCEEWLNFQNFAKWYEENYYEIPNEKMRLDKDILFKGNKIYSPQTCIYVPERINGLFINRKNDRGNYPIGVNIHNNCLIARCCMLEERVNLGIFPINKPFQAFSSYKNFKENYIKQVADEYKDLIPTKLYEAMYKYEVEIND